MAWVPRPVGRHMGVNCELLHQDRIGSSCFYVISYDVKGSLCNLWLSQGTILEAGLERDHAFVPSYRMRSE